MVIATDTARGPTAVRWALGFIAVTYAIIIIYTSFHHEPWRDEIVPLSIAREMTSFLDLWRMLRHEGHPILWYVCLRYAHLLIGSASVLPILSIVIAVAAVVLFLAEAPLPIWLKALFAFGYFPLFEYSVVARANGLAMLSLFAFCALYRHRRQRPIACALALAVLANTTALGFVVAAAAGVMIAIEAFKAEGPAASRAAVAIYLVGLGHAVVSNLPDRSGLPYPLHHDFQTVLSSLASATAWPAAHSASQWWIPLPSLWLWLLFGLLLRRPAMLAFLALSLIGFELTFALLYPPSPRHMGYVLLVVIATLWLWNPWGERDVGRVESWSRRLLLVPLTLALCFQAVLGVQYVIDDVRLDYSSAKRLATLIGSDPRLERAIVIGEPEDLTLSLPYYRDNRLFLPQENAFRNWLHILLPGGRRNDYDLAELLTTAAELRSRYDTPIIMALGWYVDGPDVQRAYGGTFFEQTFTMTPAARSEFLARTELLGRLRAASFTDENYDVFVLW